MDKATYGGVSPLFIACQEGHLDVVRLLVENGADVNLRRANQGGRIALGKAARQGHADIVRFLLANGADHTIAGKWGTPLKEAIDLNKPECAAILRTAGAHE
jgi:ankyrin repeat protein